MTDAAMWALIVGFLSPALLRFLISATWRGWMKSAAAFIWSAIAGGVTAWLTGAYQGLGLVSTILLTLVVSITAYQGFWRDLGVTNRDQKVVDERRSERRAYRQWLAAQDWAREVRSDVAGIRAEVGDIKRAEAEALAGEMRD